MVSTRNTSRSNTNPPRMQDQPGDVDNRPPGGALETVWANTDEVEVLRATNQHLLKELEQLTRKYDAPMRHDRPDKPKTLLPKENNTSTLVKKRIEKGKLATLGSMILTNPLERIATRRSRGSKGSGTSNKKSAT